MSQLGTMNVTVGADISQLLAQIVRGGKSLNDFQEQLKRFKDKLANATDPAAILRLNAAIAATQQRISTINNAGTNAASGLNRIAPSSNSAAFALTNLGRVAQDAPFGFIGIQNNLNPLLESFQRLRAESGSTGGALRSLVGSLTGAGGLGLALSLVSAGITFFSSGFGAWTRGFSDNKKAVKEAADTVVEYTTASKRLADFQKDTAANYGKEIASLNVLKGVIENTAKPMEVRLQSIQKLKEEYPSYFTSLTNEALLTGKVGEAYNKAAQGILRKAKANSAATQIENSYSEISRLEFENLELDKKFKENKIKAENKYAEEYKKATGASFELYRSQAKNSLQLTINNAIEERNKLKYQNNLKIEERKKQAEEYAKIAIDNTDFDFNIKPTKEKKADIAKDIKDKSETISDVLGKLRSQINELNIEEGLLNEDKGKERVSAFLSAIKTLVIKYKLDPEGKLVQGLFDETKFAKLGFILENNFYKYGKNASANFAKSFFITPEEIPSPISFASAVSDGVDYFELFKLGIIQELNRLKIPFNKFSTIEGLTKSLEEGKEKILQFKKAVEPILASTVENIYTSFGDSLGKVIAGDAGFGSIFSGIFKQLGAGLKQMGQYLIQTAIQIKLAKAFLTKNPALAAISGVALIALGSLIESKISKVPGFANGVNNFRGGFAVVGERGPELVNLPTGSNVIPNNQLSGKIGGENAVQLSGVFRISGSDLVASIDRTNKTKSRIT
jgi:hypothetical protein